MGRILLPSLTSRILLTSMQQPSQITPPLPTTVPDSRLKAQGSRWEGPNRLHLCDKGTRVRFCWVPSHYGIEGNEIVDPLAKGTLDHDIDPLTTVHFADLKPLVNSYIQQEVKIKWDVSIHGRDLYFLKPTLGPPKRFRHLTRVEGVVITRLRIGHTKATKSHILSRGPPTACQDCGQTLTIEHILLECTVLQQVVMSTTQLTHWGPSLRRSKRLA